MLGGGRKVRNPELEKVILDWHADLRSKGLPVGHRKIQRKALELAKEAGDHEFKSSDGYVSKLTKRIGISMRAMTHVSILRMIIKN